MASVQDNHVSSSNFIDIEVIYLTPTDIENSRDFDALYHWRTALVEKMTQLLPAQWKEYAIFKYLLKLVRQRTRELEDEIGDEYISDTSEEY